MDKKANIITDRLFAIAAIFILMLGTLQAAGATALPPSDIRANCVPGSLAAVAGTNEVIPVSKACLTGTSVIDGSASFQFDFNSQGRQSTTYEHEFSIGQSVTIGGRIVTLTSVTDSKARVEVVEGREDKVNAGADIGPYVSEISIPGTATLDGLTITTVARTADSVHLKMIIIVPDEYILPSAYFPIKVEKPGYYGALLTVKGASSESDSFLMQLYNPEGRVIVFNGPVAAAPEADVRFEYAQKISGNGPYFDWATIKGNHEQVYSQTRTQPRPAQSVPFVTWYAPEAGTYTLRVYFRENGAMLKDAKLVSTNQAIETNKAPVITSIRGPTQLNTGENAEWAIEAYDPEGKSLMYNVNWGDYDADGSGAQRASADTQKTTFTHIYYSNGEYLIIFTVTDADGASATATTTVKVGTRTGYETGSVKVSVRDSTNSDLLYDAEVKLYDKNQDLIRTQTTVNGAATFEQLESGYYIAYASAKRYESSKKGIEVVAGGSRDVDMYLKPTSVNDDTLYVNVGEKFELNKGQTAHVIETGSEIRFQTFDKRACETEPPRTDYGAAKINVYAGPEQNDRAVLEELDATLVFRSYDDDWRGMKGSSLETYKLPAGKYVVGIYANGFETKGIDLSVDAGHTSTQDVYLDRNPEARKTFSVEFNVYEGPEESMRAYAKRIDKAFLTITSASDDGLGYIGYASDGFTLPAGKYHAQVSADEYVTKGIDFSVGAYESNTVTVYMDPIMAPSATADTAAINSIVADIAPAAAGTGASAEADKAIVYQEPSGAEADRNIIKERCGYTAHVLVTDYLSTSAEARASKEFKLREGQSAEIYTTSYEFVGMNGEKAVFVASARVYKEPAYVSLDEKFELSAGSSAALKSPYTVINFESIQGYDSESADDDYKKPVYLLKAKGWVTNANGKKIEFNLKSGDVLKINGIALVVSDVNAERNAAVFYFTESPGDEEELPDVNVKPEGKDASCTTVGIRLKNYEGRSVYCDIDGSLKAQKQDGSECQNDFECSSNTCSADVCINLRAELEQNRNLMQKILDWLGKLF